MRRVESEELLDHEIPAADRERSLRDLRRLNRYAGGSRAYQMLVRRLAPAVQQRYSILDLGTGSSDLLASFGNAFRIGLDLKIQHLLFGTDQDGAVRKVAGDTFRLPFRDRSVDLVGSSHFFHHFSPEENVSILRESMRVARVGVFVTDTKRHLVPLATVQALGAARLVGPVTRHDAPASIRQGYTVPELREIVSQLPVQRFEILSIFPFRFGLILWK